MDGTARLSRRNGSLVRGHLQSPLQLALNLNPLLCRCIRCHNDHARDVHVECLPSWCFHARIGVSPPNQLQRHSPGGPSKAEQLSRDEGSVVGSLSLDVFLLPQHFGSIYL